MYTHSSVPAYYGTKEPSDKSLDAVGLPEFTWLKIR